MLLQDMNEKSLAERVNKVEPNTELSPIF